MKKANIGEYEKTNGPLMSGPSGTPAAPVEKPFSAPKTNVNDKVNVTGRYGSKKGEKRMDVSDALKPLGSFKTGTDYVPKTGVYQVHEGEAVKTAAENKAAKDVKRPTPPSGLQKDSPKSDAAHDSKQASEILNKFNKSMGGDFGIDPGTPSAIPSYKKGTGYVPKTGPAVLHKGEAVVPKEKNNMDWSKAITGSAKPKKEIKHIITKKTHDGKLMHTHVHHSPEHHPDETHVSNTSKEMQGHMDAHSGMDAGAGGGDNPLAQLTASPSPMPAAGGEGTGATPGASPTGM